MAPVFSPMTADELARLRGALTRHRAHAVAHRACVGVTTVLRAAAGEPVRRASAVLVMQAIAALDAATSAA